MSSSCLPMPSWLAWFVYFILQGSKDLFPVPKRRFQSNSRREKAPHSVRIGEPMGDDQDETLRLPPNKRTNINGWWLNLCKWDALMREEVEFSFISFLLPGPCPPLIRWIHISRAPTSVKGIGASVENCTLGLTGASGCSQFSVFNSGKYNTVMFALNPSTRSRLVEGIHFIPYHLSLRLSWIVASPSKGIEWNRGISS